MRAGAEAERIGGVGQDKRAGARPCLEPCLHNDFPVPFAPGRGALWVRIACAEHRFSGRHDLSGDAPHDR